MARPHKDRTIVTSEPVAVAYETAPAAPAFDGASPLVATRSGVWSSNGKHSEGDEVMIVGSERSALLASGFFMEKE